MKIVVFDKTGTLTEGKLVVAEHRLFKPVPLKEVMHLAAAAEIHSEHPLAQAMLYYASIKLTSELDGMCRLAELPTHLCRTSVH